MPDQQRIAEITAHADNFIGGGTEQDWAADIYFLLAEIDRLTEAQRWIPVTERVPKTNKPVQVYMPKLYMSVQTGFYDRYYGEDDDEWNEHWVAPQEVTHWRELPAAPCGKDGEGE